MRQWSIQSGNSSVQPLEGLIGLLGDTAFERELLRHLHPVVPAASYSVYQTGTGCSPTLFMSSSIGVPDTTRDCWRAYLSGPYLTDRSLMLEGQTAASEGVTLCHITAQEVSEQHRARVYDAHGMTERISVVKQDASSVFAINFYRHSHQPAFRDSHLTAFEGLAPVLVSLVQKQIELCRTPARLSEGDWSQWEAPLKELDSNLSPREIAVCARLLTGMTQDGIASDMGIGVSTVKTYRNRAFTRLGIHFRNELFALLYQR